MFTLKIHGAVPFLYVCYTLKSEKQKLETCCGLLWEAWLREPPKVIYKVLSEYVSVYFKGEKILNTTQNLRGVHDFKNVKTLLHQSLTIQKNYC